MDKNIQHIIFQGDCLTIDKLVAYQKGELQPDENNAIESHLIDCEICKDLLEGIEKIADTGKLPAIEEELKARLELLLEKNKKRTIPLYIKRLAIAASLLLIVGTVYIVYLFNNKSATQIAQEIEIPIHEKIVKENAIIDDRIIQKQIHKKLPASKTIEYKHSEPEAVSEELVTVLSNSSPVEIDNADKFEFKVIAASQVEVFSSSGGTDTLFPSRPNIRTIRGVVKDENDMPLPGATIVVKGTSRGVVSDVNGYFLLEANEKDTILQSNYVGYLSQDVLIQENIPNKIIMKPNEVALDEVVVMSNGVHLKLMLAGKVAGISIKRENAKEQKRRQLIMEKDSLEIKLKTDPFNYNLLLQLTKIYIELQDKQPVLDILEKLNATTTDSSKSKQIEDVMQLINNEKYRKALRKINDF